MPLLGLSTRLRDFVNPDLSQCDEARAGARTWSDDIGTNPPGIVDVTFDVIQHLTR